MSFLGDNANQVKRKLRSQRGMEQVVREGKGREDKNEKLRNGQASRIQAFSDNASDKLFVAFHRDITIVDD
eukprot:CAMPEP_0116562040 /NCGR_PEP_ID=MMETSP0397-20121206/11928_1 /TAXON_ID=216820 /ORGANISM="Cyclophora tenuis, Strain ECT3854" /LENGTH=70 /DNA_ID=CAMNT_0004088271 /DNA_START=461 /DNA_END=673 /DNA_ORIENTATION=+